MRNVYMYIHNEMSLLYLYWYFNSLTFWNHRVEAIVRRGTELQEESMSQEQDLSKDAKSIGYGSKNKHVED